MFLPVFSSLLPAQPFGDFTQCEPLAMGEADSSSQDGATGGAVVWRSNGTAPIPKDRVQDHSHGENLGHRCVMFWQKSVKWKFHSCQKALTVLTKSFWQIQLLPVTKLQWSPRTGPGCSASPAIGSMRTS